MPSLLRAMGFGLLLSIVALVVSNSKISVEEDVKHRVAPRAFAGDFGKDFRRLRQESVPSTLSKMFRAVEAC